MTRSLGFSSKKMVPGRENDGFGGPLGMGVGVLFGVPLVVSIVGAGRIGRLPAGIRLRNVRDDRSVVGGNVLINGLEGRVIRHHIFSRFRLHLHAHDLVNLHRDGSRREVGIELADCALGEAWLFEIVRAESGTHCRTAPCHLADLERVAALWLQPLEERIAIVNHGNV